MLCEMCGTDRGRVTPVQVEKTVMQVCSECAKFGTPLEVEEPTKQVGTPQSEVRSGGGFSMPGMARAGGGARGPPPKKKDALSRPEEELVVDYPIRIRKGREAQGWSHEDLGKKINEKKSIIAKLEGGNFRPNDQLIRKLEKNLNIRLKEKVEEVHMEEKDMGGPMTMAHFIKAEKK